ncbi:MAG: MmcQ/YjbR family DNA-binding protein [Clostridia bacterium]|nr:MmcQ/YjbR family DNA-binding protein [Clostridia bacterium]
MVSVLIDNDKVKGNVIDQSTGEAYDIFRREGATGKFAGEVREAYTALLYDIKEKCCILEMYKGDQANRIIGLMEEKYGDSPEFLWDNYPDFSIYRNRDTGKWYSLIMNLGMDHFIPGEKDTAVCMNLIISKERIPELLDCRNFFPAYHMNKKYWISVILDGTIDDKVIMDLIEESHMYSMKKK